MVAAGFCRILLTLTFHAELTILERMKNLTEKQKHSHQKLPFYRRQMWLPALVLIVDLILLLWVECRENSHSLLDKQPVCKFEDFIT